MSNKCIKLLGGCQLLARCNPANFAKLVNAFRDLYLDASTQKTSL